MFNAYAWLGYCPESPCGKEIWLIIYPGLLNASTQTLSFFSILILLTASFVIWEHIFLAACPMAKSFITNGSGPGLLLVAVSTQ